MFNDYGAHGADATTKQGAIQPHAQDDCAITADGTTYNYTYAYSSTTGLLDTLTYPISTSSYRLKLGYVYQNGMLQKVRDCTSSCSTGTVFWQVNTMNPRGEITQETLGNGIVTNRSFDAVTGWLNSIQSGIGGGTGAQNEAYLFDKVGNVTQRQNNTLGLTESFYYDNLYRLDYSKLNGTTNLDLTYDSLGNITYKSDVGTYTYDTAKKHRLTGVTGGYTFAYDNNGNVTSGLGATVTWNRYNYPTAITVDSGTYSQFWYDANHSRWKQQSSYLGEADTTYYLGGLMEKWQVAGQTAYRHYIEAGGARIVYTRWSSGENDTAYTLKDHLGSPAKVTDAAGAAALSSSFAAFGSRRASDWSDNDPPDEDYDTMSLTDPKGFTGHEHLDNLGLIHMNGRVYAPWLGKFLSADPYITEPSNTQNYNRYSYVYNNPLSLIDPSGFHCEGDPLGDDPLYEEICVYGPEPPSVPDPCLYGCYTIPAPNFEGGAPTTPSAPDSDLEEVVVIAEAGTPPCENAPQWIDANITAAVATAGMLATNATDGSLPPIGSRGVDPVTSARIAPFQQLAASTDWARVAKIGARLGTAFNVYSVVSGFQSSVADGLYASADMAIGTALAFVPVAGVPLSIAYSAHGGSKALVNDVKYATGRCGAP